MAMDEDLRADLRTHLAGMDGVVEKAMFGGIGNMWRGNLLCGVMGGELLVRIDKDDGESYLGEDGAHPMVMGGRSSRGWLLVPMPVDDRPTLLTKWVARASAYVATLPAK